ncbi:hypothetical protein MPSEU_001009800 [Mayamaea pseudoterrestris]|nr:hypothetical protein MPSEU_001009800 [Mayamaea pseudoterrestris]
MDMQESFDASTTCSSKSKQKAVLVLASSGGGTATLGHTDPISLLQAIDDELRNIHARVEHVVFVSLCDGSGMDLVNASKSQAVLYEATRTSKKEQDKQELQDLFLHPAIRDYMAKQKYDERFANMIQISKIDAVICISFSPNQFPKTLTAAAQRNIPVTGSGGTSLSQAASLYNVQIVGNAGGSVATTCWTRAVSYTSSLAKYWKRSYTAKDPMIAQTTSPTMSSVLNSCLGAFWAVCLLKTIIIPFAVAAVSKVLSYDANDDVKSLLYALEHWCIPVLCSVVMATSTSCRQVSNAPGLTMAAIIASASSHQSMLGGLLAGKLVARWTVPLLFACVTRNVPATMTNLLTSGGLGAFIALILLPLTPWLRYMTTLIRLGIYWTVQQPDYRINMVIASAYGMLSCYGSKVGWYHCCHLPLILVEMEHGDPSILGAVDELTLVLVCSGVCLGNLLGRSTCSSRYGQVQDADASLCWRGLRINLLYGDFVEACYPLMEKSRIINAACYLASGLSCEVLFYPCQSTSAASGDAATLAVTKSMAYLPWPVSCVLASDQALRFVVASAVAVIVPMCATFLHHAAIATQSREQKKEC